MSNKLLPLAGPGILLALWFLATEIHLVPPLLMPSPTVAFGHLYRLIATGDILPDILATLGRWAAGYSLGVAAGLPLGMLMGASQRVFRASFPLLDFLRSIPVTALFPLFLLFFGIGNASKVAMAFAAVAPVVMLNTAYGVLNADKTRIRAATVFGASRPQLFRWVIFFESLPQTVVGMRTTLSLALIVVIISEMFIGTQLGLGQRIYDAYTVNLTDELYAILLLAGFLGYLVNHASVSVEKKMIFWTGR